MVSQLYLTQLGSDPPVDTNDWIPGIDSRRSAQRQLALINIQQDQTRQNL